MSAPRTNLKSEARKSKAPLIGMTIAVIIGVGAIIVWLFEVATQTPAPDERAPQTQGETQDVAPPGVQGVGSVPAPEGVDPREVEPSVVSPTLEN